MQQGEGTPRGRRLPSPAMLVAVAALIAALAGTAVAVDKITSKDIARNAVRSKHIKRGQVTAKDTDVTKSRFATSLKTGTEQLSELDIGVSVKRGDVVAVQGFAEGRDADGAGLDSCRVALFVTAPGVSDQANALAFDADAFERRSIDGTVNGSTSFVAANAIEYLVPANGRFRLRPALLDTPLTDCELRDRGLAVTVQR